MILALLLGLVVAAVDRAAVNMVVDEGAILSTVRSNDETKE